MDSYCIQNWHCTVTPSPEKYWVWCGRWLENKHNWASSCERRLASEPNLKWVIGRLCLDHHTSRLLNDEKRTRVFGGSTHRSPTFGKLSRSDPELCRLAG